MAHKSQLCIHNCVYVMLNYIGISYRQELAHHIVYKPSDNQQFWSDFINYKKEILLLNGAYKTVRTNLYSWLHLVWNAAVMQVVN